MALNNFHYAISLANTLYDIDFKEIEQAEEIGLIAYNHIGNRRTRMYRHVAQVDKATGYVDLPCNLYQIESVTEPCKEDWESTSNVHEYGNWMSAAVEDFIEAHKHRLDPLYQGGRFVKYRQEGDRIHVVPGIPWVSILYHGELLDDDGLPYLNDKEALAIADYLAYTKMFKEAMKGSDKNAMTFATNLNALWQIHCDAARVPEYVNQNDMDKILNAKTSWNRKKYHFSYKPTNY